MEFKDIVRQRYACRQYEDRKIPEDTIQELLAIIGCSVSAINLQPWKIKVVSDPKVLSELFAATFNQVQVRDCSHLLVLCADTDYVTLIDKMDKSLQAAGAPDEMRTAMVGLSRDVTASFSPEQLLHWSQCQVHIALGNAVNGAYSLGLGSCPMTAFKPPEFSRILGLPANLTPTAMVSLGYAADKPVPKRRYSVSEILA
jgi:nitroreductase / dihydropteridine reductase